MSAYSISKSEDCAKHGQTCLLYRPDSLFQEQLLNSKLEIEERLHPWVKVDQAVKPLPLKSLNILLGLTLKLDSMCITVSVVENVWMI